MDCRLSYCVGMILSLAFTLQTGEAAEPVVALPVADSVSSYAEPATYSYEQSEIQQELANLQQQIDELKAGAMHPRICCPPGSKRPKYPIVKLTGFFQADAAWFVQDTENVAAVGDIQNGADFRRARLAATGQAWDNVSYMLEMDFAFPGRPSFMDVWLDVANAVGSANWRIGQYRQPFGMDGLTSVRELTFLERGLPFAFLPFRQIGTVLYGTNQYETTTWAASCFRYPSDFYGGNTGDSGGYGLATRFTGLLIDNPGQGVLHIGGGYCYINPTNNQFQYKNQPEIFVQETGGGVPAGTLGNVPAFVDTGVINARNSNLLNAELAGSYGSFYAQSELFYANVNQMGGPALTFSGAYAYAGYFLTGESRPYNRKGGVFGRVKPFCPCGKVGGMGAWEAAARWSYLDLNDNNIQGGRLTDVTFGLNWYLNTFTKFQFNYIHAFLNTNAVGDSNADILAARAQVDF